ncbi:MAG: peptide-methionine (S)-S-oxide reductase MsrA [bacterium]|nr:peptide-methionine (S)-S-oxide reductase MsrA [bacterium]
MYHFYTLPLLCLALVLFSCQGEQDRSWRAPRSESQSVSVPEEQEPMTPEPKQATTEVATLGAGCYWCVEAVLEQLDGVSDVTSGFMGGQDDNVSYKQVCSGTTGHAEVVQVTYDPAVISYDEVLDWFWRLHDPTTLNRQGADVGTQYRSVIFFHSEEQARIARRSRDTLGERGSYPDPVVTEISPASVLIRAPGEHQNYYRANSSSGYCRAVIGPKLRKLGLEQ